MERKGTFLRARLARRIFILFLAGALLPITALAILAHHRLSAYLQDQGTEDLRRSAKEAGLGMLDRLRMAETELALAGERLMRGEAISIGHERDALEPPGRLSGLVWVEGPTARTVAGARPAVLPPLDEQQLEHVESGHTALVIGDGSTRPVLLARAIVPGSERGVLWGEVNPVYLWGGVSPELEHSILCIFDHASAALRCPPGVTSSLLGSLDGTLPSASRKGLEWEFGDFEYISASWQLFLGYDFRAPNWIVTWSEPKAAAFAPITDFRTELILVFLLTLALVFLIANVQVRTNLDPVMQLTTATRRVAAGDLEARVHIESKDEFQQLAESFNAMGQRLGQQFDMLDAMGEIDRAVLSAMDTTAVVHEFLTRSAAALDCEDASVVLVSPDSEPSRRLSIGPNREIRQEDVILSELDLESLRDIPEWLEIGAGSASRPSYLRPSRSRADHGVACSALPILIGEEPAGVVVLEYSEGTGREADWGMHARNLTNQLGVAISNARLVERLDELSWGTLAALARTMDAKSAWTAGHSERVKEFAVSMGRRLDLPPQDIDLLHRASMLHDIGKVVVPVTILDKPGPLTDEEREVIRRHVTVGASILEPIPAHADAIPIVLHHHERIDGTGYPHGLAGSEIPFLARIVSVVDVFDALVSPRPYRDALALPEALEILRSGAGSQFDPELVPVFLEIIEESGWPEAVREVAVAG